VWWGLNGGAVLGQLWRLACRIQVGTKPLVPRGGAGKTKAMRALHRMAFAGTVPLLAKIPSPLT